MSEHAKRSPSAAPRWWGCPGSEVLSLGVSQRSSAAADEGTIAHGVAETRLKTGEWPADADPKMIENLRVYVDDVDELFADAGIRMIEAKVTVTPDCWGTADAIIWNSTTSTLYVRDLKYGAGIGVEVRGNLQLKIYALAALLTSGYPAKTINIGICQPRFPHPDGPVRSVDFSSVDLLDFHADLMDALNRIDQAFTKATVADWEEKFLHPSEKACRFCLAAPNCPKVKKQAQELAKVAFAPGEVYDPKQLAHTLDMLPLLEAWIKNCRQFAYEEAEAGRAAPGYKLVEKTAHRKFRDDLNPSELAKAVGVSKGELYSSPTLLGITEIQKMVDAKNDRERAAVLEPFVIKESSGHTLVHDTDKRSAIRVDAKAAFA